MGVDRAAWRPYALAALIVAACVAFMAGRHELTIDTYKAFYCGGKILAAGGNPYLVEPLRTCEHAVYSAPTFPAFSVEPAPLPTYALAGFAVLALLPMHLSYALFVALMAAALFAIAFALAKITDFSPAIVALVALPIWAMTLGYGEIPPFAVAAIALCGLALVRERYTIAAAFACVAMIQPHVALPLCVSLFLWMPKTRVPLVIGAVLLAAIGLIAGGAHNTIAYYTTYLPAQNASEIIASDQYSLTHVLHIVGVSGGLASKLGFFSYLVMLALGVFAARRLARELETPALIAFVPAAFVLLGGPFLHDTQILAALPLALTLLARAQYMRPLIAIATVLLATPWTQSHSRLLIVAIFIEAAALGFIIFNAQSARLGKAVLLAVFVTAAVLGVNRLPAPSIDVANQTPIQISGTAPAADAWHALLLSSTFWSTPSPRSEGRKVPTWLGLAFLLIASLRKQQRRVPEAAVEEPQPRAGASSKLYWVDAIKGLALFWIVWNHVSERIFGSPYMANPTASWPALGERIAQLAPIGHGLTAIGANLSRYIGWTGDQGVGLFIVISGFLLALGQIQRPTDIKSFYDRRLLRIYPLWIGMHIAFILLWFAVGKGLDPTDPRTLASILGLRFLPGVFYYFAPAWWYVGLALQLYLVFPLLAALMRRYGALRFLISCIVIGCAIRGIGLFVAGGFVDEWSRGGIFITRLPEFAFGMWLAAMYVRDSARFAQLLRAPQVIALAVLVWIAGNAASLTLWGLSVAPLLLSLGSFVLAYAFVTFAVERVSAVRTAVGWTGEHSYSLYLLHQPFIVVLVAASMSTTRQFAGIAAALAATAVLALVLEWIVARAESTAAGLSTRFGAKQVALSAVAAVLSCYVILLGAESIVRVRAPLEVFGWGERPSLQADPIVGWKLKPNQTHRLRWTSYDYVMQANALGFPGEGFAVDPPRGTFRIMTLGDAFTSAEGVDTQYSWPRRLQGILDKKAPGRVQVMNFAITGYGPNQYSAVTQEYAPIYHPKLIVIGMFINDFEDALRTNDDFRQDIGFGKPPADGLISFFELQQLKAHWAVRVRDPLTSRIRRRPTNEGAFFGNIRFFDRKLQSRWISGAQITRERYAQIQAVARRSGAQVAVVLFPASVQVCGRSDLRYYPSHFSLDDSARYDRNAPQNLTQTLTASLRLPYDDLRPALRAGSMCPYQPRNMHLTVYGQDLAANAIAGFLRSRGLVPRS
ncbi:MAG TPA: acyltransferase family protein [Candidatus Baltobacteraceae bacterium]|nr:acyltransferase family protein [Candidatus Baltobacteraceae bacterium]